MYCWLFHYFLFSRYIFGRELRTLSDSIRRSNETSSSTELEASSISIQQQLPNSFLHNQVPLTMLWQCTFAFAPSLAPHRTEPMAQTWGMAQTTYSPVMKFIFWHSNRMSVVLLFKTHNCLKNRFSDMHWVKL